MQGICKRGLECTFAHGVEDMQVWDDTSSYFNHLQLGVEHPPSGFPSGSLAVATGGCPRKLV